MRSLLLLYQRSWPALLIAVSFLFVGGLTALSLSVLAPPGTFPYWPPWQETGSLCLCGRLDGGPPVEIYLNGRLVALQIGRRQDGPAKGWLDNVVLDASGETISRIEPGTPLKVTPGSYSLCLQREGYADYERDIQVHPDGRVWLRVELEPLRVRPNTIEGSSAHADREDAKGQ